MSRLPFALAALLLLGLSAPPARPGEEGRRAADVRMLLEGVKEIAKPGVPGPVALIGKGAFAVVAADVNNGARHAVVAAARHGPGRLVAFGHPG